MRNDSESETALRIRDLVSKLLKARGVEDEPEFESKLTEQGLTSLDMVNLVLAVEAAFGIQFEETLITPTTFRSIASIEDLVTSRVPPGDRRPRDEQGVPHERE